MDGTSDHKEVKASNQIPKPLNQELKDVVLLFGLPQTVVEPWADRGEVCLPTST